MNKEVWREKKKYVDVNGSKMAYVEMGAGDPIIFQHGNPTSSYLWRNIMPQLADVGRCIAVDLIGMGDSDKLPNSGPDRYTFKEHQQYLYGAWEALGVTENVTFVIHDWGSALGFDWCRQHPGAVKAVAHMEGVVQRLAWEEWPEAATEIFHTFRSPAGEDVVLQKNVFVEGVLPNSIMRKLTDEEMDAYRAPFVNAGEDRRPTWTWPRQIPLGGEPVDVCETVDAYGAYMKDADMPKLFIAGDPGMIMNGTPGEFARSWKNTSEATVKGLHFLQEDSPDEIAGAVKTWLQGIETPAAEDATPGGRGRSMLTLVAGFVLLLCLQQLHNVATLRAGLIGKYGLGSYRIGLGALGLAGVTLVFAGKSHAAYAYVWLPPVWLHLFVVPGMFVAFIFVAAEVVPSNLQRFTKRPFLWGMVLWAITHLMVNGDLAAMSLFGGFGLLAILELFAVRRRGGQRPGKAVPWAKESLTVAVGGLMFIALFYLHAELFGRSASMLERSYF